MSDTVQPNELNAQLSEMREKSAAKIPEDAMAVMMKAMQDLAASGITKKFLKEGAQAPDFSLPSVRGEQVKLSEFLVRGPVVLAFYRGGW